MGIFRSQNLIARYYCNFLRTRLNIFPSKNHMKFFNSVEELMELRALLIFFLNIRNKSFSEEVACADPDACRMICENPSGCFDIAYPLLVTRVLPDGL